MIGPLAALLTTCALVYLLLKKYQSQIVLSVAGFFLLYVAIGMGAEAKAILGSGKGTGLIWFEPIKFFTNTLSSRAAGLGMIIMAASGYAKYMDSIGASRLLASTLVKPLRYFKSPYLVVGLAYLVGQFLNIFIPSASGLAMLLMVTIYPVLIRLGVSPLAAAACVGTTGALDLGPGSGNASLAARTAGLEVADYFVSYQIPAGIAIALTIAVAHILTQYYMDKRDNFSATESELAAQDEAGHEHPPFFYILLPMLPLILLLTFSSFAIKSVKLDVPSAMFISGVVAIILECIRHRDAIRTVFKDFMIFFDTMGTQFARVISLIVAGETFAQGLMATGTVDAVIKGAQSANLGGEGIIIFLTMLIAVASVIMGSGNAPFFAFAALAPAVSKSMGMATIVMVMPMQLVAGIARGISPITAVIVATAGIANVSPFDLVRRTAIPMIAGIIMTLITGVMFS